jgi:hypothetical protein
MALSPAAHAGVVDNTSLASPGVYFGTGNANSGFTVDTESGIEVGLSAINRYVSAITPTANAYDVSTGDVTVPGKTGSTWGIDYSINLQDILTLSDISAILTVTDANNPAATVTVNLLSQIPDNTCYNGSVVACTTSSAYGAQNSEPGSLLSLAGDPGFQDWTLDTYTVTLTVSSVGGSPAVLATDSIIVNAVPEPGTLGILAAGLAGLGLTRRRRRSTAVA